MAARPSAWGLLPPDLGLRLDEFHFPASLPAAEDVIQRHLGRDGLSGRPARP